MFKKTNNSRHTNENRVKPVIKSLPLVITGKDKNGNDYDTESCYNIVKDLQNSGCFDKLSVNVNISKNIIIPDGKGTLTVARIQKYDIETGNVELLFFGKNATYAESITNMVVVPRVRIARNSTEVNTIFNFEIVPAMEA